MEAYEKQFYLKKKVSYKRSGQVYIKLCQKQKQLIII